MKKLCRSPREERCISEVVCFDFSPPFFEEIIWFKLICPPCLEFDNATAERKHKHSNIKQHQQNNHIHTEIQHIKSWNGIILFVADL